MEFPIALALATGLVAAVNPCGFGLLPAYLSVLVVTEDGLDSGGGGSAAVRAVGRALALTAAMTAGFLAVFGIFGLLLVPVGGSLLRHLPWVTVGIGAVLMLAGGWLLAGRHLPSLSIGPRRAPTVTRSLPSMAVFGTAYAVASLGCTIGPFLAVVIGSLKATSVPAGIALLLAYGLGMGLTVGVVAVTIALARTSLVHRIRRAGAAVTRIGGLLLVLSGAWVAYYGWFELRVLGGDLRPDGLIGLGGELQVAVSGAVGEIGVGGMAAALLAVLAVAGALTVATRRGRPRGPAAAASGSVADARGMAHLVHGVERRDLV